MSEIKEKQFAVLKQRVYPEGVWATPSSIVWFDARKDARKYRNDKARRTKKYRYTVVPMTRGPGA